MCHLSMPTYKKGKVLSVQKMNSMDCYNIDAELKNVINFFVSFVFLHTNIRIRILDLDSVFTDYKEINIDFPYFSFKLFTNYKYL